jgi:hypothetical protein
MTVATLNEERFSMIPPSTTDRGSLSVSDPTATEVLMPVGIRSAEAPWINGKASAQALRAAEARKVSGRRRYVDPATSERDYTAPELEFMHAMQEYKKRSGRLFPTWSEVLEVLRDLGYRKPDPKSSGTAPVDKLQLVN